MTLVDDNGDRHYYLTKWCPTCKRSVIHRYHAYLGAYLCTIHDWIDPWFTRKVGC